ncbi:hypothetical protein AVEN_12930-1 [Araneus ventricosus]|uniref:Reverse transcriptase domain-containing protein n=1 Tax=Araneus ventricosus TaxID=182803 RepID=A0A4Y2SKQ5_ARAVE|nr:hypothetical protein AVEN_12930-1 [Araneus ventricosus]
MNGHSPLWGNPDTNTRGLQVEKILNDHNLCLLNNDEYTYFHEPTRTFHSVDLAICTPSVLPYCSLQRFGILRDLYECNPRGNLPIFIQNLLKLRKFRVQIGNQLSDYFIQEEGVPQGSVLSVTLFALKINDILKQLPPSVKGFKYVDDLYISCAGDNINFIERQLQLAVNKIQQWSSFHGFTFSTAKTCIHFCRKRRLHPEPEIPLGSQLITVVNEVKFLGITFDKKLTFRPHVIKLRKKLDKALNILKVLSNTSWGASRTSLLRVYRAAILSKMDYGCVIYGSARQSVLKILDPIHHSALRLCSGAFRTSPVESLYVECC